MGMSDEGWKALSIIIPAFFGMIGTGFGVWMTYLIIRLRTEQKDMHKKVNGLLAEKTIADIAKGVAQEKSDQFDRESGKKN